MTGILFAVASVLSAVCLASAAAADLSGADSYIFVLCDTNPVGLAADPDAGTCYADHADFWESFPDCMVDRLSFIIDLERRFGPKPREEEISGYRCIPKAAWLAAVGPDLRAPIAKLPKMN